MALVRPFYPIYPTKVSSHKTMGLEICKNTDLNKYVYDKWKADKDRFHHGPWMQSFKIVRKQKLVINIVRKLETQLLQFPFYNDSINL